MKEKKAMGLLHFKYYAVKMKILMFGWEFPPHISGGLGTACYGLTSALLQQGENVTFVVPRLFGDEDKTKFRFINASEIEMNFNTPMFRKQLEQLKYIEVSSGLVPYFSPEEYIYRSTTSTERYVFSGEHKYSAQFEFSGLYGKDLMKEVGEYALVAGSIASQNDFDAVHAHDWLTYPAGIVASRLRRKPLIIHVHATEFDRSGDNINQNVYDIEREGMEKADSIITVSGFTKQILIDRYGIPENKITVVHNGVLPGKAHTERKPSKRKYKIVTFLGRVTFQKGPDYFVESAKKVLERFPDTHFVMAGSGDMLTRMIKRVAQLRIGSRFHFTGFLKGQETDHMFSITDAFVMPSVSEPFGISPLEAIQSGVPVIISKQSGVSEVLKNAVKIDFWDTDALANAICSLLQYKSLSDTIIRETSKEVESLTWERAAAKVKGVYNKLHLN
ncbi:MAG TPA: glycosyltransferase family 4 protein [Bacteroidia bacterium]|nr:glycosyltransferase family 4 protein [Bacteroidia bacterium]